MRRSASRAATTGFAGGLVVGLVVWSLQVHRAQHDLFSTRGWRRRAALGFLRGQRSAGTVRVLREYVGWERNPSLRRRGEAILRRLENALE